MSAPKRKKDWVLTQDAFDRLLAQLDGDRERAGREYERIRQKLKKFFKWRGCSNVEEYTDRSVDRVARRICEGAELRVRDPYLYFHGVALNVLREHWRESERQVEGLDDLSLSRAPSLHFQEMVQKETDRSEKERRLKCLAQCLDQLSPESLHLVTKYHQGEGELNKVRRKKLAEGLGIPLNALRIRAHRIRAGLENCIQGCMQASLAR